MQSDLPTASIIVAMRNERRYIEAFLESLARQDYPREKLEILLVDGESDDGSREIAEEAAAQSPAGKFHVLQNPDRWTPRALNLALEAAKGEIIVRMDVHAVYAADFTRQCVRTLLESDAAQVGGPQVAEGEGGVSDIIAAALNSPFGVGGASFRYLRRRAEVDSVYLGCSRRETLQALGGWDVAAVWDEDTDLNARLRRQGGRLLVAPEIRVRYHPRRSWRALSRQYANYGFGRARTFRVYPETMRLSHLVPPAFWASLTACAAFALARVPFALPVAAGMLAIYGLVDVIAAWRAVGGRPGAAGLVALTFPLMHGSWTAGLLVGIFRWGVPLRGILQALGRIVRRK